MRVNWPALLVPALAAALVAAAPSSGDESSALQARSLESSIERRDGHGHAHNNAHTPPIVVLNETEVLMYHAPTPDSYWSLDIDGVHPEEKRYPALMGMHVLFMSAAFFGALPVGEPSLSFKVAWNPYLDTCTYLPPYQVLHYVRLSTLGTVFPSYCSGLLSRLAWLQMGFTRS